MTYLHPLSFPLGLHGIALLRAHAGECDDDFAAGRVTELRELLAAYDRGELGDGSQTAQIDTVNGYRAWARTYDEEPNALIDVEEPVVRTILEQLPPGRALDAACGTGRWSAWLTDHGHDVVGIDTSPDMLAKARANTTADFRNGDLTALPLPDADVDLVVCALALPHLPSLGPALAEFARVLRPGGHLVLSDIHWQSLYLGGIASAVDADGTNLGRMPATRFLPSDYLKAALPLGFAVRGMWEPRWPASPAAGGEWLRRWAGPAAVDTAYETTPAALIWHLQLAPEHTTRFRTGVSA